MLQLQLTAPQSIAPARVTVACGHASTTTRLCNVLELGDDTRVGAESSQLLPYCHTGVALPATGCA